MAEMSHEPVAAVGRFWRRLRWLSRICLVVTILLLAACLMSFGHGEIGTTDSGLDTFFLYRGSFIWKHRSAPRADFVTSTGPWVGLRLPLYLGDVMRIKTRGGQHFWYIEVPLWFLVIVGSVVTAVAVRRDYRREQASGFPIDVPE